MIQIDDKVLSIDLFRKKYICDISKCHGECCYEGDSGAPLDDDETQILEDIYPIIEPLLTQRERDEIARQGKWVIDPDGDKVTPIIDGRECVYTLRQDDGTWMCAIEKAYNDGLISFKKPISCHLYPIRIDKYRNFDAVNFHEWHICKPALVLGKKVGMPVFRFLREAIVRKYGQEFYNEMEKIAPEIEKLKINRR